MYTYICMFSVDFSFLTVTLCTQVVCCMVLAAYTLFSCWTAFQWLLQKPLWCFIRSQCYPGPSLTQSRSCQEGDAVFFYTFMRHIMEIRKCGAGVIVPVSYCLRVMKHILNNMKGFKAVRALQQFSWCSGLSRGCRFLCPKSWHLPRE